MTVRNVLYADEGKILTDGETYGKEILLEVGREASEFHEISKEEYEEILKEEEEKNAAN